MLGLSNYGRIQLVIWHRRKQACGGRYSAQCGSAPPEQSQKCALPCPATQATVLGLGDCPLRKNHIFGLELKLATHYLLYVKEMIPRWMTES